MEIRVDDLTGRAVQALLHEHLQSMFALSPAESVHALDLDGLRHPDITFWTVWHNSALAGCGALKALSNHCGEIKSMRTVSAQRGKGVASHLLTHLICEARERGYERLYLETGTAQAFIPAYKLYQKFGFVQCGPFENYTEDPHSIFIMLPLQAG